jgi:hypothetical protein
LCEFHQWTNAAKEQGVLKMKSSSAYIATRSNPYVISPIQKF